ncbi:hypothetical protein ACVIW2_007912 [Bradyrhizobium huanghuaihaiense]|uniref:Uncharacterized protein n=1 Tax=Bradyrhizobium huanghuaihaiense TaxID=990078 RepID=A0A562RQ77_9BRAD|nr:hypothetical protein IQ16_02877 [Bradyrhizobium huanghuaihaiense]
MTSAKMVRGPMRWHRTPRCFLVKTRILDANRNSTSLESALEYQPACKPGSVGHRPPARTIRDGHSSGTMFAHGLEQPTRTAGLTSPRGVIACANSPLRRPYSVLLPVGFTMPAPLPAPRCALTAPFHPYPSTQLALLRRGKPGGPASPKPEGRRRAVRSLWHFPWGCPRRMLSGTACQGSPDFPPRRPFGTCRSGRPAD